MRKQSKHFIRSNSHKNSNSNSNSKCQIKVGQDISKCKWNGILPERRCVVGDDDELGLALPEGLERLLVAQHVLAGLHDEGQARVDGLGRLLLLLLRNHLVKVLFETPAKTLGNHLRSLFRRQRRCFYLEILEEKEREREKNKTSRENKRKARLENFYVKLHRNLKQDTDYLNGQASHILWF